ncbi:MAG: hypothetical protein AAF798_21695 [Bacteroidota bacterium]
MFGVPFLVRWTKHIRIMGGIKDLLGLYHWMDNGKRPALEKLLTDKRRIPKEKLQLLREVQQEIQEKLDLKKPKIGFPPTNP